MDCHVYILRSLKNDRFYIGQTQNIQTRIEKHNAGYVKSTKPFSPWVIVYLETCEDRSSAMKREKKLKALKSRDILNKFVAQLIPKT
ncbi:MAG: GIY-YIG nuclease family protein [Salibacteraceae bacterium]